MLTPKGQKRRVNVPRHPGVKSARGLQETMFSNDVGKVDNKPLVFLNECLTPANTLFVQTLVSFSQLQYLKFCIMFNCQLFNICENTFPF